MAVWDMQTKPFARGRALVVLICLPLMAASLLLPLRALLPRDTAMQEMAVFEAQEKRPPESQIASPEMSQYLQKRMVLVRKLDGCCIGLYLSTLPFAFLGLIAFVFQLSLWTTLPRNGGE